VSQHDRDELIERQLGAMRSALREIVFNEGDCMRLDEPKVEGCPCSCARCIAQRTLDMEAGDGWRFVGRGADRLLRNPREAAVVAQWSAYILRNGKAPDAVMEQLIGLEPTPRDWYVATSIIQWLATNVGRCILTESGWFSVATPKSDET
jgi:hypothetical protein